MTITLKINLTAQGRMHRGGYGTERKGTAFRFSDDL
jgi:hypothetical protein